MRIIVMFDLPMETSKQRTDYASFRKNLLQDGFIMMQKSVYCKLIMNPAAATFVKQRIERYKPKTGLIQLLLITEKQYSTIEYILGEGQTKQLDSTERLVFY